MKKNILIFARDMLPYRHSAGDSIRPLSLAVFLKDNGYDVTLVSAKGNEISGFGLEKQLDYIKPIYIKDFLQEADSRPQKTNLSKGRSKFYTEIISFLKYLLSFFYIPDRNIIMIPKYFFILKKIIKEKKINYAFFTSPPHSTQILSLLIKKNLPELTVVTDYRDGWNTFKVNSVNSFVGKYISRQMEKSVLKNCDYFTYQSDNVINDICNSLKLSLDDLSRKSFLVRNGSTSMVEPAEQNIIRSVKFEEEQFTLGYFGGINFLDNSYRNPNTIFEWLDKLNITMELKVFGEVWGKELCYKSKNFKIEFYGKKTLQESKALMLKCDGLFVFHAESLGGDEVIPGKLYEYIESRTPILSFGPENM